MQMIRKHLWIKDLLTNVKQKFDKIKDTTAQRKRDYSLTDCLMSGLAIFGMKYPSLLQFDTDARHNEIVKSNLNSLYRFHLKYNSLASFSVSNFAARYQPQILCFSERYWPFS